MLKIKDYIKNATHASDVNLPVLTITRVHNFTTTIIRIFLHITK